MAKSGNVGSKVKTQVVMKRPKGQKAELGINTTETNEIGDFQAKALFAGFLLVTASLFCGGMFYAAQRLYLATTQTPIDWVSTIMMIATLVIIVLVTRSLLWLSFFGAIMYATKNKAWRSQERLARAAIMLWKILPGAASTATLVLAQNLLGQNKPEEAIKLAEEQWQRSGNSSKADQNIAHLCSTVGIAHQMRGEVKESIVWNERSIEAFKVLLEQVSQPKGFMAKLAASQGSQWVGPLRLQLAAVSLHNANAYFSTMSYRQAKENYKRAIDAANQAPESAEKQEVLRVAREQMGRLKHA